MSVHDRTKPRFVRRVVAAVARPAARRREAESEAELDVWFEDLESRPRPDLLQSLGGRTD